MCQALTVSSAEDAAMRKKTFVAALEETRAGFVNYYCECGHCPRFWRGSEVILNNWEDEMVGNGVRSM